MYSFCVSVTLKMLKNKGIFKKERIYTKQRKRLTDVEDKLVVTQRRREEDLRQI